MCLGWSGSCRGRELKEKLGNRRRWVRVRLRPSGLSGALRAGLSLWARLRLGDEAWPLGRKLGSSVLGWLFGTWLAFPSLVRLSETPSLG